MPVVGGERSCKIRRERGGVDEARRFAELSVPYCDRACREATAMVVTELAENIVKYAATNGSLFAGTIAIARDGDVVRVRATNPVRSAGDANHVMEAIARINAAASIADLYRSRLAELMANQGLARAQLGLLRAVFEGGFQLSCKYAPPELIIVAERRCEAQ